MLLWRNGFSILEFLFICGASLYPTSFLSRHVRQRRPTHVYKSTFPSRTDTLTYLAFSVSRHKHPIVCYASIGPSSGHLTTILLNPRWVVANIWTEGFEPLRYAVDRERRTGRDPQECQDAAGEHEKFPLSRSRMDRWTVVDQSYRKFKQILCFM